jgi:enediyne biosynthesis protein E2
VCGFEWGIEARRTAEVERRLGFVEPELRGFAYEGATMAFTIRDTMRGHRTRDLLRGSGEPHIFLAYIGIGFAMARLPRPLWRKVLPDLAGSPFHPTMSWLAVDGYGFDRAYFDTRRWVERQYVPAPYPWLGDPAYFLRAVDQGVGRALWFIHGGRPAAVAAAVGRFAPSRQPDLWAGVGLAATFAGGCEPEGLAALRSAAGPHRDELALGVVFAATAREYSGCVPEHTGTAVEQLAGLTVAQAVDLGVRTAVEPEGNGPVPQYEVWRGRIRAHFAGSGTL